MEMTQKIENILTLLFCLLLVAYGIGVSQLARTDDSGMTYVASFMLMAVMWSVLGFLAAIVSGVLGVVTTTDPYERNPISFGEVFFLNTFTVPAALSGADITNYYLQWPGPFHAHPGNFLAIILITSLTVFVMTRMKWLAAPIATTAFLCVWTSVLIRWHWL